MIRRSPGLLRIVPFDDGTLYKEVTPANYTEGPFMLRHRGKYYFMWSEGGWTGPDYCVAYAIADSPFGPWTISESSIYRTANEFGGSASMYFGTSGLSIKDKFKVDANGKLTCTGASISGEITATSLNVTNAVVTGLRADDITAGNFSASRINGGILDFNNFSVDHLSASDITTGTLSADYIKLGGDMAVYSSLLGSAVGGYLGYTTGDYGGAGIHLMSGYGEVVATTSGAKL